MTGEFKLVDLVKLRSKNQITIPKGIVSQLEINTGSRMKVFCNESEGKILLEANNGD